MHLTLRIAHRRRTRAERQFVTARAATSVHPETNRHDGDERGDGRRRHRTAAAGADQGRTRGGVAPKRRHGTGRIIGAPLVRNGRKTAEIDTRPNRRPRRSGKPAEPRSPVRHIGSPRARNPTGPRGIDKPPCGAFELRFDTPQRGSGNRADDEYRSEHGPNDAVPWISVAAGGVRPCNRRLRRIATEAERAHGGAVGWLRRCQGDGPRHRALQDNQGRPSKRRRR